MATENRGFVALQCCSGHGTLLGRAFAGEAPEDFLLASVFSLGDEVAVGLGDAGYWYDPLNLNAEAGIFRFAGGTAEAIDIPATFGTDIAGATWLSVPAEGDSTVLVDANTGSLLTSTQDFLFLTATPTVLFPTETAERTFTANVILSGLSYDIQTFEAPVTDLTGTPLDFTFNVDLATGAIPYGRIAFSLPNGAGDVQGRFSGQVLFDTDYHYLDVGFFDGSFAGAPLDLFASELQGFFSGQNAETFVGGFSLLADLFLNSPVTTPGSGFDTLAEGLLIALSGPADPLLLSSEEIAGVRAESGSTKVVVTSALPLPSDANLSLPGGLLDSQAERSIQLGIADESSALLVFSSDLLGATENFAGLFASQASKQREAFLFDADLIMRSSQAESFEPLAIYRDPAGISWDRLVNPAIDFGIFAADSTLRLAGQEALVATGVPAAHGLNEERHFGFQSFASSLYTPIRVPVLDAEIILDQLDGQPSVAALGVTAALLATPGFDSPTPSVAGSLQIALLSPDYQGDPFLAPPSSLQFVSLDFATQLLGGLMSGAGIVQGQGSVGDALQPSDVDLFTLDLLSSGSNLEAVALEAFLTGFLSEDQTRPDLFQLSFEVQGGDSNGGPSIPGVTGLALLGRADAPSEKIWLGNYLIGYAGGGKVASSSDLLGHSQFYFAFNNSELRYYGPEEFEFFSSPLDLSPSGTTTLGLIRGAPSLFDGTVPPVELSPFNSFNDPLLGGGDLRGESWDYCDTVAGFCSFRDGSAYEYFNVETGLKGAGVSPIFNWISGTPVAVSPLSQARHYFAEGVPLELKRYLTQNSSFETDWRDFDSFSLDFDFDPSSGRIEFGRITAFSSDNPEAFLLELDFFGEVDTSGGHEFAFFYPLGGALTENGVRRPFVQSPSSSFGGFFNGANATSTGNNLVFTLDLEFDSGSPEETLRVGGIDVASGLVPGSAVILGSEQLPSGGFNVAGLLAFPMIDSDPDSGAFFQLTYQDPNTLQSLPGLAPGVDGVAQGLGSSLRGLFDDPPISGSDLRDSFVLSSPAQSDAPAVEFRAGQSASTEMQFLAMDGIGWGIWNSAPGTPVKAFDAPNDPSQGPVIPGYALYAGGISPAAPNIPGGSTVRYELSYTSGDTFAAPFNADGASILIQRSGTEGEGLNNLNFFVYRFDLDLANGDISNGLIDIRYTAPGFAPEPCCTPSSTIAWENQFSGFLPTGSASPLLSVDQANLCVRGFCVSSTGSEDLSRNRLGGVFSGAHGEVFWGSMSLEGRVPADLSAGPSAEIIESLQVLVRAPCISSECVGL